MKPHGIITTLACGALAVLLCGCGKGRESITMAGSTAFQPFAEKLAEEFMRQQPAISITAFSRPWPARPRLAWPIS